MTYVGRSYVLIDFPLFSPYSLYFVYFRSMEIKLDVGYTTTPDKNTPLELVMSAYFQMVARDMNNKSAEGIFLKNITNYIRCCNNWMYFFVKAKL